MYLNEIEQSYEVKVEFSQFEKEGYLTPSGYQHIANVIADRHLYSHDMSFEKLMAIGISWVLLSVTVDIINPIKSREQKLIGKTWYSGRKGVFFRREIAVTDENNTPLFNCSTHSTLINLTTRSIFRNRELPFEMMEPTDKFLTESRPTFKERLDFEDGEEYVVRRSYLDMLGHVNNGRYGDFCFDALTDEEADMKRLRRIEVYFVSELKQADKFSVKRSVQDDRIVLLGQNETAQKPSFYGVYGYLPEFLPPIPKKTLT